MLVMTMIKLLNAADEEVARVHIEDETPPSSYEHEGTTYSRTDGSHSAQGGAWIHTYVEVL